MKILISNDDGVIAEGLKQLYLTLKEQFSDITVVAPDSNCSGMSNGLTLRNPLRAVRHDNGFHGVNGLPADCVNLALDHLLPQQPDVLVSGINHGANMGQDVIYSGTVAAAIEGFQHRIPSLSVSLAGASQQNLKTAAKVVCGLLKQFEPFTSWPWDILNVNVPDVPYHELKGIMVSHLGRRRRSKPMRACQDPWGRDIFWYGELGEPADNDPTADFSVVAAGYVSVTPIHMDMTSYDHLATLTDWINEVKLS